MTATIAALHAKGRATLGARTPRELCDMYVLATAQRDASTGDEFKAAIITLNWIGELLERRDQVAVDRWYEAEEAIEIDMLARNEWVDGASSLAPHPFFGIDVPVTCDDCFCCSFNACTSRDCPSNSVGDSICPCTCP